MAVWMLFAHWLQLQVWLAVLARKYEVFVLKPDAPIDSSALLPQFTDGLLAQFWSIKPARAP